MYSTAFQIFCPLKTSCKLVTQCKVKEKVTFGKLILRKTLWKQQLNMASKLASRSGLDSEWNDVSASIDLFLVQHERKFDEGRLRIIKSHWIADKERKQCSNKLCAVNFSLTERKHHCRRYHSSLFYMNNIKAFFNTMDWWGICPTGPLPLPHH
jgi:hypothetical protein